MYIDIFKYHKKNLVLKTLHQTHLLKLAYVWQPLFCFTGIFVSNVQATTTQARVARITRLTVGSSKNSFREPVADAQSLTYQWWKEPALFKQQQQQQQQQQPQPQPQQQQRFMLLLLRQFQMHHVDLWGFIKTSPHATSPIVIGQLEASFFRVHHWKIHTLSVEQKVTSASNSLLGCQVVTRKNPPVMICPSIFLRNTTPCLK